jgi:hypothetical protein
MKIKLGKKELAILIPLIVLIPIIIINELTSQNETEESVVIQTNCEEGWLKYETDSGTLCSKTELTEEQIQKEFNNYGK